MTSIRWTSQALEDVAEIRNFIARDAPGYAEVVVVGSSRASTACTRSRIRAGSSPSLSILICGR